LVSVPFLITSTALLYHFPQRLHASYYALDPRPYLLFIVVALHTLFNMNVQTPTAQPTPI